MGIALSTTELVYLLKNCKDKGNIKTSHQLMAGPLSRRLCPSISRNINLCTCIPEVRKLSHLQAILVPVTLKLGQGH